MKTYVAEALTNECADDAAVYHEAKDILKKAMQEMKRLQFRCRRSEIALALEEAEIWIEQEIIPELDVKKGELDEVWGKAEQTLAPKRRIEI